MTKLNFKQSIMAGLYAGGAAAVFNAVLFFIFKTAGVITDNIFVQPNQPLGVIPVLISSILPALIGSMVFFIIEKYTKNGYKIFSILSIVLVVISLYSPFKVIPGVTMSYALVLCVMHFVVAISLLYFIGKSVKFNNNIIN